MRLYAFWKRNCYYLTHTRTHTLTFTKDIYFFIFIVSILYNFNSKVRNIRTHTNTLWITRITSFLATTKCNNNNAAKHSLFMLWLQCGIIWPQRQCFCLSGCSSFRLFLLLLLLLVLWLLLLRINLIEFHLPAQHM